MRSFLKKYNEQVRIEKTLNQPPAERITNLTRGRLLIVGPVIDEKVRKFLMALFRKGEHISCGIVSTTANVFFNRSGELSFKNIKTLRKLPNILQEMVIPYLNEGRKKIGDAVCTIDMGRFSRPENRSGNFFTTRAKNTE